MQTSDNTAYMLRANGLAFGGLLSSVGTWYMRGTLYEIAELCYEEGRGMKGDQVEQIRGMLVEVLRKHGVRKAALFGSIVRGEATEESDIDLLIEFEGRKSLLDLAGLKLELQESLRRKVDVVTYKSLHPLLKERILSEQKVIL